MGDKSKIGWTEATWNPISGCSKVSEGCRHCYAETVSHRWGWTTAPWTAPHAAENVQFHPDRLDQPLRWQKPRRIFVNSISDVFHEQVDLGFSEDPVSFVDRMFAVMAMTPRHTYQILTKRPERAYEYLTNPARIERLASVVGRPNWGFKLYGEN
jgi:protein gp37